MLFKEIRTHKKSNTTAPDPVWHIDTTPLPALHTRHNTLSLKQDVISRLDGYVDDDG